MNFQAFDTTSTNSSGLLHSRPSRAFPAATIPSRPIQIPYETRRLLVQIRPILFYRFSFTDISASLIKIERESMKKLVLSLVCVISALSSIQAQSSVDFSRIYGAGGRMWMSVDSLAENVYYGQLFPNQPNTSFNYLPEVNQVNMQVYFRQQDSVQHYRYTILEDDKPIAVNKSIDIAQLNEVDHGDGEVLRSITLGVFPVKGKTITTLVYDIERPLVINKSVFYGKPIPRVKIKILAKRFATDKGVDYDRIIEPTESTVLTFNEKDDELTIVKDGSAIDYLYGISIKDKRTDKLIFESTAWQYGGYIDYIEGYDVFLPYVKIDKSVFKKSGDYEIIIQPLIRWGNCSNCHTSPEEIAEYTTRHTLSVTLIQENYTTSELLTYLLLVTLLIGSGFLVVLYFVRKRNKKKLMEQEQHKNTAKLHLSAIRSQLNPHFLFNALSGIQNLMNKNETDNANTYLAKFARLTRNVLGDKELISLLQEKSLLDDYLQMEQLRFGFAYEITHATDLDLANVEIPSMLLQPFVENAVKHGISQQGSTGKISIEFMKRASDLVLTVSDNGNGFDTERTYTGLGLQLSDSRIALLNEIYKENRFTFAIRSTTKGTEVRITLTDWL